MKSHFFLAGINFELSNALAFTSKYKISYIEDACHEHIRKAKKIAQKILDSDEIANDQRAQAYFYLGASEGYLGIFKFGSGHLLEALLNGFQTDNHLEKSLVLAPNETLYPGKAFCNAFFFLPRGFFSLNHTVFGLPS